MKSKKSLFNATLFKSNISRFLPFSVLFAIIELIIFPLVLFFNYNNAHKMDFEGVLALGAVSYGFTGVFAIVFALLTFGYLFSANKCNALHAFPIGRKALFTTNFLSAYALLIVPQLIGFLLGLPGILLFSLTGVASAFIPLHLAMIFIFSFIVLSIAALAIMLSGNAFAGFIIYGILNFFYAAFVVLASTAVSFFGYGLNSDVLTDSNYYCLSPVIDIIINLGNFSSKTVHNEVVVNVTPKFYIVLLVYFIVAIAICALAFLLYKLRELEVAGEMAAFEKELPFIRVIVSVIGGAVIAMTIGSIVNAGKIGMLAIYVVFSFIVYFAAQMVLKRKFNIFSIKLVLRWAVCCAVSIGVVLGLAAYETNYIPDASKVDKVLTNITYDINYKNNEEDLKQLAELQTELIKYAKSHNTTTGIRYAEDVNFDVDTPNTLYLNVEYTYTLKNGKTVSRNYEYDGKSDKINALIKAIENKNQYTNVFDYLDELGVKYTIKSIEINSYEGLDNSTVYNLRSGDYREFVELCKEDIAKHTENYSSLNGNSEEVYADVWIECRLDKNTDNKTLKALEDASYGSRFIEGYLSYDSYEFSDGKTFQIHLSSLSNDSEAMKFAKEKGYN